MTKNLKKRIYTSLVLFFLLFLMLINNFFLGYFLIIVGVLSIIEFFNIIKNISTKSKINQFFSNVIFIIYISIFCSSILIFSYFLHLKILIFAILITCIASDIGGYVFGKIFKGRKLSRLSPNKTFSGAIGSLIFSVSTICLLSLYLTNIFNYKLIFIGCFISIICQIGDLFFSYLKRKSFLKDTSNFLPGHGGVLDRIDSILFGLPLGFLLLLIIY